MSLVTGGGVRVGGAISRSLADQGSDLAIHYRHSRDKAESTADELSRLGIRAECFAADLSQPEQIVALFQEVHRAFGRLDVLVNSAASFEKRSADEIDAEAWDSVLTVNLRSPFLCTREGAGLIRASQRQDGAPGLVVNIADLSGLLAWPGYAHHGSAKAGLLHLTELTARELAPQIRVNSVVPGPILPLPGSTVESEEWQQLCRRLPVGGCGYPSQIGDTVVFLAQNDFIVGTSIVVDGGEHLLGASHRF